jgi:hypothetical protein
MLTGRNPAQFAADGRLRLVSSGEAGQKQCFFLDRSDHRCQAYPARPLECRLYPFLLSREQGVFKIYAHLACPFLGEQAFSLPDSPFISELKAFFSMPAVTDFLKEHAGCFADYSGHGTETVLLFEVAAGLSAGEELLARQAGMKRWLSARPAPLSTRSFVNLFAWKDFFTFDTEEFDGNLCVYARQDIGTFLYWPPLGACLSPKALEYAFQRMKDINRGRNLTRIENLSQEEVLRVDAARYAANLQGYEYYYYRQDIAGLKGGDYKSRRHDINLLTRSHRVLSRPFTPGDAASCREVFERWLDNRYKKNEDVVYRAMLEENRPVHRSLLAHAASLGLIVRVVEVDGGVAGYTAGYALSKDTFCVLLEVTDPRVQGLPAYIFRELAADPEVTPFKFLNAMDDFGMPGVARAKMSYRPAYLEPVFSLTERA